MVFSDLNYYGSYISDPGFGSCWRPYFAGYGWTHSPTAPGFGTRDLDIPGCRPIRGDGLRTDMAAGISRSPADGAGSREHGTSGFSVPRFGRPPVGWKPPVPPADGRGRVPRIRQEPVAGGAGSRFGDPRGRVVREGLDGGIILPNQEREEKPDLVSHEAGSILAICPHRRRLESAGSSTTGGWRRPKDGRACAQFLDRRSSSAAPHRRTAALDASSSNPLARHVAAERLYGAKTRRFSGGIFDELSPAGAKMTAAHSRVPPSSVSPSAGRRRTRGLQASAVRANCPRLTRLRGTPSPASPPRDLIGRIIPPSRPRALRGAWDRQTAILRRLPTALGGSAVHVHGHPQAHGRLPAHRRSAESWHRDHWFHASRLPAHPLDCAKFQLPYRYGAHPHG